MSIAEQALEVVREALARRFVTTMSADRRSHLEADLRACCARVDDGPSLVLFRQTVERRMWAEEHEDELDGLSPEELGEIKRRSADAAAHPDRLLPWEAVFPPPRLTGTG